MGEKAHHFFSVELQSPLAEEEKRNNITLQFRNTHWGGIIIVTVRQNTEREKYIKRSEWYPTDRPSMKVVIQMLKGENMPVMPPNPFAASESANINTSATSGSLFSSEFDSISERSGSNNLVSS
ncbi:unnamed protein product [Fraxinus pennsylvanica]|uniref:Uncharacterized protein n=1 Tax=Fraxinus pennsylvanica TaxID=56036 RepID=A0AAD2DZZ3_9LAMI|nr:unnamed protein product [Fraxinus pennsylvanica]